MLGINNVSEPGSYTPDTRFNRSIIFIPKWLENRARAYSKSDKTLKDIDGLFSILIPADVSLYLSQVQAVANHPACKPYFNSFNVFSHADKASWNAGISNHRAAKKYNEIMDILQRGSEANNKQNFAPLDSYVENNTSSDGYGVGPLPDHSEGSGLDRAELAGILGVDPNDPSVDLLNLRVIIEELDADTLIMRLTLSDPDQNRISQALAQTEANIIKITQYYEFKQVIASPVGKYYSRLVLVSANS